MSSTNRWLVLDNTNGVSPTGFLGPADSATMLRKCSDHLGRGSIGAATMNLALALNPVAAKATITMSGNGTNGDTLTVGNTIITLVTSGAAAASNQVNLGATGNGFDIATWIAALINGTNIAAGFTGVSTSFNGICTASANAAGVITLTAFMPGTIGNGLALSKSSSIIALTNLWGASIAGTEGTYAVFQLGQ